MAMTENIMGGGFLSRSIAAKDVFIPEEFSKEHKAIAKTVREFVAGEIKSRGDEIEHVNNDLSRELMQKAGDIGLLAADIPEAYGGMALDKISSLIISDVLGEGAGSFTITELNHTGIGTLPLAFFGSEDQKQRYLPGLSSGVLIGAFGLTEPDAGSDALNARTTAVLSEDGTHYILNGSKTFITNAGFADLIFTFAKVDGKAFTAFIVEFDTRGISTDAEEIKMGMKGTSTRTVTFNNVKVPKENVLGAEGKGHVVALNALNMGRFKVGAVCVGSARGTFTEAIRYAAQRVQFGQPICQFGLIKEKIADMAARLFAGESMMYRTAGLIDARIKQTDETGPDVGQATADALREYMIECSIMKIYGSETQAFVADESVQIFGGYGYIYENPAELAYRNARINRIWEGTNEINRITIANAVMKQWTGGPSDGRADLSRFVSTGEDSPETIDAQIRMLESAKAVARCCIDSVYRLFGGDLRAQQELAGIVSDMVIEIYVFESAYLRACKLTTMKQQSSKGVAGQIAKVLSVRLFDRIRSLADRAMPALMEDSGFFETYPTIETLLRKPPLDTIALNRQIADHCVKKKGYPFKGV